MARSQRRSLRKVSGGRYHYSRTNKSYELTGVEANTKVDAIKRRIVKRGKGGKLRNVLLAVNFISVADKKGKVVKTEISNVVENQANANLVRRNIITKGCVVETKLGRAKVTSRPGQDGTVNGVLI